MKSKIYCQLNYGFSNEPNCSNFGDRILQWEALYDYILNQNKLDSFDIILLNKEWKERKYINLLNTKYEEDYDDSINLYNLYDYEINSNKQLDVNKNYTLKSNLLKGSFHRTNTHQKIFIHDNSISDTIRNMNKNPLVSLHIRKGLGVIGSEYSAHNEDGYPDFTWMYYNKLIKTINDIFSEYNESFTLYIGCDLPINIVKQNINAKFLSRLDFINNEDEIKLHDEHSEITYIESNICDWLAFYHSDIVFVNPFSSFSNTASEASNNVKISMLDWSHEFKLKIEEYLSTRKKVI
jgi:hypothetical protein